MQTEPPSIQVDLTPEFRRNLRNLSKKSRQIRSDIQPVIEQIQAGNFLGDQIAGIGYTVLKLRVKNSDIQKGKSGGYRLIYQVESPTNVLLITIYSKLDQEDISANQIRDILAEVQEDS